MAFPQYRIPVQRLKEEWELRKRMERLRSKQPPAPPSKNTDYSEPYVRNPTSVAQLWEIACRINETVAKRESQQDSSSPRSPEVAGCGMQKPTDI